MLKSPVWSWLWCGAWLVLAPMTTAHADISACTIQGQNAIQDCEQAEKTAELQKDNSAAPVGQASTTAGIKQNSAGLSSVTSAGIEAQQQGITQCTNDQQNCRSACTPYLRDPNPTISNQAREQIDNCEKKINPQITKMQDSATNLKTASTDSKDTGQSASSMPQMPSPSPSPSPTPTPSATPSPSNSAAGSSSSGSNTPAAASTPSPPAGPVANCAGDTAFLYADCADQLEHTCNNHFKSSSVCESFSSRYCNSSHDGTPASSGAMQAGSGLGTPFCQAYLGVAYPTVASSLGASAGAPASSSGGGASSSSGGGSGIGAAGGLGGGANLNEVKAASASANNLKSQNLGVDGGGGGASSSSGGNGGSEIDVRDYASMIEARLKGAKVAAAGRGPASAESGASDVAAQRTSSLFSISSRVLLNRCLNGQLLHCAGRPH